MQYTNFRKQQPFIEYINEKFANKNVGSLRFNHYAAVMHPPILPRPFKFEEVTYDGVHNVYFRSDWKRQPKVRKHTTIYLYILGKTAQLLKLIGKQLLS